MDMKGADDEVGDKVRDEVGDKVGDKGMMEWRNDA